MYRVLHYKAENEAKLIQRMMIWQGFGCIVQADTKVLQETKGKAGVLLYNNRTLVANGFFEAVDHFKGVLGIGDKKKATIKKEPVKTAPKVPVVNKPKAPTQRTVMTDPFDENVEIDINF